VLLLSSLLEKVKNAFLQEEKEEKKEDEPSSEQNPPFSCPHSFGYLAKRRKKTRIPDECLACVRMLECRKPSD
jgi:hypothetical protein